ncbi:MAG: thioredoxin domain-containing protein, partial [Anaerolineae bacterium]|nr:thioredoxin domain-containing protein [Anaerolineae bacterium]
AVPTPTPGGEFYPRPSEVDWSQGAEDATVTFVVYSAAPCEICGVLDATLTRLLQQFPADVRVVYRHYPLAGHPLTDLAAGAMESAGLQGRFFEFKSALYSREQVWQELQPDDFVAWLGGLAVELELDKARFLADLQSEDITARVEQARMDAEALGIPGVPHLVINGSAYQGPRDATNLALVVRLTLLQSRQYDTCPPMTIDFEHAYTVRFTTEKGDVLVELFPEAAPVAVNSFIFLAREGWYDDTTFHRVLPDFLVQGGDPSGTGYGGPGFAFDLELTPELTFDRAGRLALVNSGPNSNGSQFFITLAATPDLDGQYTIFGQVLAGLDVLRTITPRDPALGEPLPQPDRLLSVEILEE